MVALGLPVLVAFVLLSNALGAWGAGAAAVYQTSLVLYLFTAGFAFGLIILSFLGSDETEVD